MQTLARFKGHFFNWYDTLDLQVLDPPYVSSVDSGNLAGHLIVLANTCEEWIAALRRAGRAARHDRPSPPGARRRWRRCRSRRASAGSSSLSVLDEIDTLLTGGQAIEAAVAGA